jgi:hypothetical protein
MKKRVMEQESYAKTFCHAMMVYLVGGQPGAMKESERVCARSPFGC